MTTQQLLLHTSGYLIALGVVIAVTGSLPVYDPRFERALTVGGRLFVVVGPGPVMEAQRITRAAPGEFVRESLFEASIDPLVHATEPPKFVF